MTHGLQCTHCGAVYPFQLHYLCLACQWPLKVTYNGPAGVAPQQLATNGIWRHSRSLPPVRAGRRVSLGEGNTPLLSVTRLTEARQLGDVHVKNEGLNPTGSFKDRGSAVAASTALEFSIGTVVCSSTGNAGISVAAYAAAAGLRAVVLAGENADQGKLGLISGYGAQVVRVKGTVSAAYSLARQASASWRWMNVTSTFVNPFSVEGHKSVAFEVLEQLGRVPDYVIVPVSVGPLLVGIFSGFLELRQAGLSNRLPRMVAAQASRCAPLALAFERGDDRVVRWEGPVDTVAGGIADPLEGYEQEATYALQVVRESGGCIVACDDDAILDAQARLASEEGILAEPTGAVSIAALQRLHADYRVDHAQIVSVVTGTGLKNVAALPPAAPAAEVIEPGLRELEAFLESERTYRHGLA
jgi:threonine synthase